MSERLRGAIVGCGMIAEFHLRGWARIPEVEVVALCDLRLAAADARRAAFAPAARTYDDIAALLAAERLDFVDVITPPEHHAAHVRQVAAAGVHVICQKPLCPTLAEARALVGDLSSHPKLFLVHENHRYRPWFAEVRRRASAGLFGRPLYLRLEQLDPYEPAETFKAQAERGVMFEYGTHLVDMMRAVLGEPRRVHARMHRQNARVRADSVAHVVYDYEDATAVIDVAWKAGGLQQGSALLVGDRGEAFYEGRMTRGQSARLRLTTGTDVVLDEALSPTEEYVESFHAFERAAVDAMLGRAPPPQPAAENVKTLACTLAAYRSAEEGCPVEL